MFYKQASKQDFPYDTNRVCYKRFQFRQKQCCEVGAVIRGAEIKLPPGAEITNCGSGSFLFTTDLKKL